jgi:ethanolamine utilization microcompartment shell protein EutS
MTMALQWELIIAPSPSCKRILMNRIMKSMPVDQKELLNRVKWGAVLLLQGMVAQTIAAVDIATDIASVEAFEVMGNCPQHMPAVAIVGSVSEVERALEALKSGGKLL